MYLHLKSNLSSFNQLIEIIDLFWTFFTTRKLEFINLTFEFYIHFYLNILDTK